MKQATVNMILHRIVSALVTLVAVLTGVVLLVLAAPALLVSAIGIAARHRRP